MFRDLVIKSRTVRRFKQAPVSRATLMELVDAARFCPSGSNKQPLRYFVSADPALNAQIFTCLAWAGHIKDWGGPAEGERPTGYILVLGDTRAAENFNVDHGIAAQTIMLAAAEKGLGGCIIGSVKRDALSATLKLDSHYQILLALALGVPLEKVVLEELAPQGDYRYWRDAQAVHHVPKRALNDIVVG
jgi:nitroreductase